MTTPESADTCRVIDIDGTPVRIHGAGDMGPDELATFTDMIRAAKRLHRERHPDTENDT